MQQEVVSDDPVNEDVNRTPWIGVYKGGASFEPRTIGYQSFEADISMRVLVQATSLKSGNDCSVLLDDYVSMVLKAIRKDLTLSQTVDIITRMSVEYSYTETDRSTLYFQMASIIINATKDDIT